MNTRWIWELDPVKTENIQDLWHNSVAYFKWCEANPIRPKRTVIAGKEVGRKVEIEKMRPYSLVELCVYCGITEEYIKDMMRAPRDSEAFLIVGRIIMNIKIQLTTLALVGEISPVLADKIVNFGASNDGPQKILIEHVTDLPKLANSEIEILENINIENGEVKISKDNNEGKVA